MTTNKLITIDIYRAGGEWFGARCIDGEYDGCDSLEIPDHAREAEAIEAAKTMPLAVDGERIVRRVDDVPAIITDADIRRVIVENNRGEGANAAWEADHIGRILGRGEPASEDYAQSLGADYVCALSDGSIVAWGASRPIPGQGRSYRELIVIEPGEQLADDGLYVMTCQSGVTVLVEADSADEAEAAWDAEVEAGNAEPRVPGITTMRATLADVKYCVDQGHDYRTT